jgi:hypothetical protein
MVERNESWAVQSSMAGRNLSISYRCCSSSRSLADSLSARCKSATVPKDHLRSAHKENSVDFNGPVRDVRLTIGSSPKG